LLCGENSFPRAQCSKDVSAFFNSGDLLSQDLSLDLVTPSGTNVSSLLTNTVDAFAEDIDNDGDNDLVVLKRNNRSGNATRLANNTIVESLNTSTAPSPMRCLGIPGEVDIESLVIAGDYLDSSDIRFGPNASTVNTPNTSNASARRFVFNNISRANNIGLPPLPDISDGVDENERGMYIGYVVAEQMWKICDVIGVGENLNPAPQRRFNLYGMRAEFSGPVGELIHEGYDPDTAPIRPIIWINNGDNGNGIEFENTTDNGGIDQAITAFALGKGDFDNDGDMDFIASYENYSPRDNHYLYTNDGTGNFSRSRFAGCPTGVAESVAVLDANADGRLDAVVACAWFGLAHDTSFAHSLWLNNSDNDNQAIMFDVVGNNSNRSGIGARITVTDANDRTQAVCTRDVGNTFGRGSQDSEYVHCGVALRETVDVIVDWPGGNGRDIYDNVSTGGLYTLEEGSNRAQLIRSFNSNTTTRAAPTALPELEINSVTVNESIGTATLAIQLRGNATSTNDITVNCASMDNTAVANDDYTATAGLATIRAGQQRTTITIPIIDDTNVEPEESFSVQLSNPSGATITTALGVVTVIDNDSNEPLPVVEASYRLTDESDGEIDLFIRLQGNQTNTTQRDIRVDYTTEDITALAGEDYVAVSGTAVIPAGSNESIRTTIQIIDDNIEERVEFFRMRLSNAVGATIAPDGGIVTITDTSPTTATPIIGANYRGVTESTSNALLFIRLNDFQRNNTNTDITVNYTTVDLTATADVDYVPLSGTAVIAPGERNTFVNVPIINDAASESSERFLFQLSNPRGAILSETGGIVTIVDDD